MTRELKLWAYGPFEILLHAETHYLSGGDIDRRLSLIGFDNAIELAITTYLNPSSHSARRPNLREKGCGEVDKGLSHQGGVLLRC